MYAETVLPLRPLPVPVSAAFWRVIVHFGFHFAYLFFLITGAIQFVATRIHAYLAFIFQYAFLYGCLCLVVPLL